MFRNHLLVFGPSGSGKTYLLEQCLPSLGLPFKVIDGSGLVPSGYKGVTLQESLEDFFRGTVASSRNIVVLDEFDKISERANGGDTHKSHSIQSELLTLVQGKKEGSIDTTKTLWIFAGAFAYTNEMHERPPALTKDSLLKYGFKNELLGRIAKVTMTDIPTTEELIKRIVRDKQMKSFTEDFRTRGYDVSWEDEAILELALAAQNPAFGMRIVSSILANLKETIIFDSGKGKVSVSRGMVSDAKTR